MAVQTASLPKITVTKDQLEKWGQLGHDVIIRNELNKEGFQAFMGYPHLGAEMDRIVRKAMKRAKMAVPAVPVIKIIVSQQKALAIMGNNFFGIQEATTHFAAKWNQKQLDALATVPFSDEVLEACKETHVLVAGYPMTILKIREKAKRAKKGKLFYSGEDPWYNNENFARQAKVEVRWYLISKTPVDKSINKSWSVQQNQLNSQAETPKACVMVYTIIGHFFNTGERLFKRIYVRCSDLDSDGDRVGVGSFDLNGLRVLGDSDDSCNLQVGLSASRKYS